MIRNVSTVQFNLFLHFFYVSVSYLTPLSPLLKATHVSNTLVSFLLPLETTSTLTTDKVDKCQIFKGNSGVSCTNDEWSFPLHHGPHV